MEMTRLGEFALIERIRHFAPKNRHVLIGIGDDAAWVRNPSGTALITIDILIEGVDFKLKWTSLFDLGYKALAVNLSDIAAMGGVPDYVVLGLGIPRHFKAGQVEEFYQGFASLAAETQVALVGGDISLATDFTISACVSGHPAGAPITRAGAHTGDDIYVTGTLGDAALGLSLLSRRGRVKSGKHSFLVARHCRPKPRLTAGFVLGRKKLATAMIDISDGLLQDLGHIATESTIGAEIWASELPLSSAYRTLVGNSELDFALSGGEDYELLFCAAPENRKQITKLEQALKIPVKRIGVCVPAERGVTVLDSAGKPLSIRSRGYDHFRSGNNPGKVRKPRREQTPL